MIDIRLADCRRAATLALAMIAAAAVVAGIVHVFAAAPTRAWLDFGFGGIPNQVGQVVDVLLNNLRLLATLLAGAGLGQLMTRTAASGMRVFTWLCDAIVIVGCAVHVFLVGATVGAYGDRGVGALLPHGPIELAGFALGLSLYVAARRERVAFVRGMSVAGLAVLVLAIAAYLEVMVT